MLIHEDNLLWDASWHMWQYYLPDIGGGNEAYLYFTCKENEVPKTGDKIENNQLVKAGK